VRRLCAVLALAFVASGCGYALVGRGITTDPSIKRIGVPIFKDRTGKPGLDQKITARVIEELLKRGRFTVVQDTTGVDAVVDGEITSYTTSPVGFTTAGATPTQASRYAINVTARVVYRKIGQKEPIWQSEMFSYRDEYDMGESAASFFDREEQTVDRIAEAFGKNLVAAMLEAF
jgi:lipopolysaccharide assembly LptE-like protein